MQDPESNAMSGHVADALTNPGHGGTRDSPRRYAQFVNTTHKSTRHDRREHQARRFSRTLAVFATLTLSTFAAAPGCVTETKPLRPGVIRPGSAGGPTLPEGPIARPADAAGGAVASGRIVSGVATIGSLDYNGLTLPIFSPSGAFVAVHQGPPPTWEALTAQGRAAPGTGRIMRLSIRERSLEAITSGADGRRTFDGLIPAVGADEIAGAVLGRSADEQGFLVEQPMPDGSRRIGKVDWLTGRVDWIVQDGRVNAHAVLLRDGSLIFASRTVDSERFALKLLPAGANAASVLADADDDAALAPSAGRRHASLEFPMLSPDQTTMIVQQVLDAPPARGVRWRSWVRPSTDQPWTPGVAIGVSGVFPPSTTFLASSPIDAAPSAPGVRADVSRHVAIIDPRSKSIALLDGRSPSARAIRQGTLIASIAGAGRVDAPSSAAASQEASAGLLIADGQSVSWQPWAKMQRSPDESSKPTAGSEQFAGLGAGATGLLSSPGVVRVLAGEPGSALVLVPERGGSTKLVLLRLRVMDPK